MIDEAEHTGRRNALILSGVAVVVVLLIAAMLWLMNAQPALQAKPATATSTITPSVSGTTIPDEATTSVTPPVPSWSVSTPVLPPPEEPTETAPVPGETADPDPDPPTATAPATTDPVPQATAAMTTSSPVNAADLVCTKDKGDVVTATLTLTTAAAVPVILRAGDTSQPSTVGPGTVSLTAAGRGLPFCVATVAGRFIGPVPAR